METDPSAPPPPIAQSFFSFPFSLSLKHSLSRKNPIIEISGPCWKRDSLWNVFGVTQRQCLSCPSANRMLCAGERREIRTDNGKRERPKKKWQPRGQRTNMDRERGKKTSWETADAEMIWWPQERQKQSNSTVTVSLEECDSCTGSRRVYAATWRKHNLYYCVVSPPPTLNHFLLLPC